MKLNKKSYLPLLVLPVLILSGCMDDSILPGGPATDPNAITFSAFSQGASASSQTRSGELPIYDPLELNGNDGFGTLYLHTYETDKIGYRPGEDADMQTRGNQVVNAEGLIKHHKNFVVMAKAYNDGSEYFNWMDTRYAGEESINIWYTSTTQYWPGNERLSFYAVSPSAEFGKLNSLTASSGQLKFSYTARKGEQDRDAEAQTDLLTATSACNKAESNSGRAPLHFHHALSAVKFAIRDVLGGEVVNIKIAGVHSSGDCMFWASEDSKTGDFEWTNQQGKETYSQNFNYAVDDRLVDPNDPSQDILLNDKMPEKTFMMIPQEIPDDAEIIVTLKRTGPLAAGMKEEITVRGKIKANNVTEWKAGHEYVYTISTSKDNWVYTFEAYGNHNSELASGEHNIWGGNYIYVFSPAARRQNSAGEIEYLHNKYGNNAFMNVRSFRYRANNPSHIEDLSWTASHEGSGQYRMINGVESAREPGHDISAEDWIPSRDMLYGNGSHTSEGERKDLVFAPHHQLTNWPGDEWMQKNEAYPDNSADNPWDLSTCGSNSTSSRNTANCYVIDRQGYYKFPLIYGNAIKNGRDNPAAYSYSGTTDPDLDAKPQDYLYLGNNTLKEFPKHSGNITKPEIEGAAYAKVIWTDVYNAITIEGTGLDDTKQNVVFQANKENMQQGNAVIAVYNSADKILWSWHIWITEHWLDTNTGKPNAMQSGGDFAIWEESKSDKRTEGWRTRGDVKIDNQYVSGSYNFYISPYNLGWCDPKDIDYLRRKGEMKFVQYKLDGTPSGKEAVVPILQEGVRVAYQYGNNVYYQWGRKDPFIGFYDHTSTEKRNFISTSFTPKKGWSSISDNIANPMKFYYNDNGAGTGGYGDWTSTNYINLWNNNIWHLDNLSTNAQKVVKTVYDPCPPGYVVPPAFAFRFVGATEAGSFTDDGSTQNKDKFKFNGRLLSDDLYTMVACVNDISKTTQTKENSVWLAGTGERWDRKNTHFDKFTDIDSIYTGGNFNATIAYMWSANCGLRRVVCGKGPFDLFNAFSTAIGLDLYDNGGKDAGIIRTPQRASDGTPDVYSICVYFPARRTMARPVRPIREQ